jgi:hypothetical protein
VTEGRNNIVYTANGNHSGVYYSGNNVWDLDFGFEIKAPELVWDTNGVNLEAQLPVVTINRDKILDLGRPNQRLVTTPAASNTKISIIYNVPDANDYDWNGGPTPYSVTPAKATYLNAEVTWYEPLNALNEPTPVGASNNSAASLDSLRTFIAGALVGAGAGALVGAVQEATHRQENQSSPARISPPGSASILTLPEGRELIADNSEENQQ